MNKTSIANEAVIQIRKTCKKMEKEMNASASKANAEKMNATIASLRAIEQDLYQVKNRSGQDPLNFPIKLNNRFASLRRSVETGDARPTDGAYQVFKELSAELDGHLKKLDKIMKDEVGSMGGD